jgi:peptide/nickel transport system permease protein
MLINYILKRVFQMAPMLIAVSALIFFVIKLPPGDFLTTYIQRLELSGVQADQSTVENLKRQYGLDRSDVEQYFIWVRNIVTKGDFGRSMQWNEPVSTLVKERIGWTMTISLLILCITYLVAIPVGIYAATHKYTMGDYFVTFIGFVGMATPGFLLALVLVYLLFINTGVVFVGLFSEAYLNAPWSVARFMDLLPRLGLVVGIIGLTSTARTIRVMRAMTLDELEKQYVVTARSKGLAEAKMLRKYPIRMAINPICSTIGWALPEIISGEVVVSIVMNMPTIGPMLRRAFMVQDMYLAGSMMLFVATMTVVGTLLSDILLAVIDPRIKFGGVME